MTVPIAALAICVLSALSLLPAGTLPADTLPANFWAWRDGAIVLLGLLIAGLGLRGRETRPAAAVEAAAPAAPRPAAAPPPKQPPAYSGEALVLLSLLQEKGRFIDYVMEDITAFNDAQVAAASRVVHQGCAAVIREYFAITPTHEGAEGERVTLDKSADPHRYRLLGKVAQEPPYTGVVVHRGWKTAKLALPRFTRPVDPAGTNVITPMEVEVR